MFCDKTWMGLETPEKTSALGFELAHFQLFPSLKSARKLLLFAFSIVFVNFRSPMPSIFIDKKFNGYKVKYLFFFYR